MGNTKSQARGFTSARGGAPVENDPFAELADIFESELQHDPRFAEPARGRSASMSARDDEFGFDRMDQEFETAFENDLAAARKTQRPAAPVPSYETQYNGRSTAKAAPVRKPVASRPAHLTDEEIDSELDMVLRNLSAPAMPRGRIVVETQSFAPERAAEEAPPPRAQAEVDEFEELIRSELAVIRPAMAKGASRQARYAEPVYEEEFAEAEVDDRRARALLVDRSVWKRRLMAGGSLAVFLLMAGAGYSMWHASSAGVSASGDEPFLIKADAEPYKIVPKDPGGRAYPNQNKAVYDRVASPKHGSDTPTQQALLKNVEEPMELPAEEEGRTYAENLPGVEIGETDDEGGSKDQTRITASTEAGEDSVLQPRKVRTMTVGPDGKLMVADAATPAVQPMPTAETGATPPQDISQVASLALNAAQPVTAGAPRKATKPVSAPDPVQTAAVPPAAPQAVASLEPQATGAAMPDSGFFVQVSSQPTEAAAQQSLRAFGSRYGSVVGSRPVGIKSGEVAGKGTYWRVRVAANSKEEAASLCSKLKSAGASCFVTR